MNFKVKEFLADPRRRVVLATILTSAILLVLVVALVVSIVNGKPRRIANESSDVAISTPVEDKKTDPVDNSNSAGIVTIMPSESTSEKPASTSKPEIATTNGSLPKTGPESVLPLALFAGIATYVLLDKKVLAVRK